MTLIDPENSMPPPEAGMGKKQGPSEQLPRPAIQRVIRTTVGSRQSRVGRSPARRRTRNHLARMPTNVPSTASSASGRPLP
jgi:hypothetical protein